MSLSPSLSLLYDFVAQENLSARFGLGPDLTPAAETNFSSGLVLDGTDDFFTAVDTTWLNHDAGVLHVECSNAVPAEAGSRRIVQVDKGGFDNAHILFFEHNTDHSAVIMRQGNATSLFDEAAVSWAADEIHRMAYYYDSTDARACFDGTLGALDSTITLPTALTTLRLGADASGTSLFNGTIRQVRYYNLKDGGTGDPDQFIQDLTNGLITESPSSGRVLLLGVG